MSRNCLDSLPRFCHRRSSKRVGRIMVPSLLPVHCIQRYETSTNRIAAVLIAIALRRPQLAQVGTDVTQVSEVAMASWLPDALEELRSLRAAGVNMPGIGDFTVSEETADRARQLITLDCVSRLPAPTIVPFSGGGIAISWSDDGKELLLCVFPSQEVTYERKVR